MHPIIEDLSWRYATDKFDPTRKIRTDDLNVLLEVLRLAPSSYGLQPIKVIVIESKMIREQLREKSWNQPQITDASHLIVLCSHIDIYEKDIDDMISNTALTRKIELASLNRYSDFLKRTLGKIKLEEKKEWNMKQAYIALGHLLHACAQLRIDSTPMEGFDADAYDEILNLKSRNLHAAIVCAIGFRDEDDTQQFLTKVRKSKEELIEVIR